jgi:CheY-like chemotaxis protein
MPSQQKVVAAQVLAWPSSPHMCPHSSAEPFCETCNASGFIARKLVLLVEDEPLIAYDVENHLRKAGARVITAGYRDAALSMTAHPDLSRAVVDLRLGNDSAPPICRRLAQRDLPFVVHSGYATEEAIRRKRPSVPIIERPAAPDEIVHALSRSLSAKTYSLGL